ncbi:MAG: hypothetical protein ACK5UE_00120 [Chitinophagales bacterium]|jgi:hypothetical protein|nr:hypothetical protein [Sphingobacteriales bacterium]
MKKSFENLEALIGSPNFDLNQVKGGELNDEEIIIQVKGSWFSSDRKGCGWICGVSADGETAKSCNPFGPIVSQDDVTAVEATISN